MKKRVLILILVLALSGLLVSCAGVGEGTEETKASSIFDTAEVEYCRITSDTSVRAGAGRSFAPITRLNRDERVNVVGQIGEWYVVHLDNNRVGCIDSAYARPIVRETEQTEPIRPRTPYQQIPPQGSRQEAEPQPPIQTTRGLTSQERQMIDLVNQERRKNDLPSLKVDMELIGVARMKAQDMVDNNYFSHYSPNYGSPFDMMNSYGIEYFHAGENIAANSSVTRAHQSLMESSGHRQNILSPNFTHIGVGIKPSRKYGYIFVQMFISKPQ